MTEQEIDWLKRQEEATGTALARLLEERKRLLSAIKAHRDDCGCSSCAHRDEQLDSAIAYAEAPADPLRGDEKR